MLGTPLIPSPVSAFALTFNVTVAVYVSSFASVTVIVAVYSPALSPVFAFTLKSVFVALASTVGCVLGPSTIKLELSTVTLITCKAFSLIFLIDISLRLGVSL